MTALTTPADEQLSQALPRRIAEVADRYGISLYWSLAHDVDMSASNREQISRIVREAVINAARHGAATSVHVRLDVGELAVSDDGCGFDVGGLARTGAFGLISMRERANAIGARLQIRSTPGHGTEVRVTW